MPTNHPLHDPTAQNSLLMESLNKRKREPSPMLKYVRAEVQSRVPYPPPILSFLLKKQALVYVSRSLSPASKASFLCAFGVPVYVRTVSLNTPSNCTSHCTTATRSMWEPNGHKECVREARAIGCVPSIHLAHAAPLGAERGRPVKGAYVYNPSCCTRRAPRLCPHSSQFAGRVADTTCAAPSSIWCRYSRWSGRTPSTCPVL
ncbi:hypothetical protein Zmor_000429 [Zophobas morio]|uniref:Uncharacterized protein n=1 Tax=Zophobas morio TaxID=2755281 RepID=A0AA38J184_9CUCU|nr:hypothetical protein Zmor_000429 [Zophobas morio]